jgi:hypothetical protein
VAIIIENSNVTTDGTVSISSTSNWGLVRDALSGTADHTSQRNQYSIRVRKVASGRGTQWQVWRAFFAFNTNRVTQTPVSGTLHIKGFGSDTANIAVVKSTHSTTLTGTDFNNIDGWSSGDNIGNVTFYGPSGATAWDDSGYNVIQLSQAALSDMASLSVFKLCLLNYTNDLRDVEPNTGDDLYSGCYFYDASGTSHDPYITMHPDNAVFMGANF